MNSKAKYVAKIGVLAAIAFVVMQFKFPLTFVAPSFYKLDLSESVTMIGGFALGPLAAVIIELLKNLLDLLIGGTTTAGIGELSNFLVGCSYTVPAAFIYKNRKSAKSAIVGMTVGTVSRVALGAVVNYFIIIPAYSSLDFPIEAIVGLGTAIIPWVNDLFTFVLFCTVPFNLIKGVLCSVICYILYKRVSPALHI